MDNKSNYGGLEVKNRKGQLLIRRAIWSSLNSNKPIKTRLIDTSQIILKKFPIRPGDLIIVLGTIGFYTICLILWKNYYYDTERTTYPYKLYYAPWMLFPYVYSRQAVEPFKYTPDASQPRDLELFNQYEENKANLLFKKKRQWEVTERSTSKYFMPTSDHQELDFTEYQTLTKINFDQATLLNSKKHKQ